MKFGRHQTASRPNGLEWSLATAAPKPWRVWVQKLTAGARATPGSGALLEIAGFLLLALAVDSVWGMHDRYTHVTPHPFWIVVIVASSYYGSKEGLVAVLLSALALLIGNLPPQQLSEDTNSWLLRVAALPLQWCLAALVLGLLRDTVRDQYNAVSEELASAQEQLQTITAAYERLLAAKEHLEARVVSQQNTVPALYRASRVIERNSVGEVLQGVLEMTRSILRPAKMSLFLMNDKCLEACVCEGWEANAHYDRELESGSPLFQAVVDARRYLVVTDPNSEALLGEQGMLAGPLVNAHNGVVVGMLKIEFMAFLDLNLASVQNFRTLCAWVGTALAQAQHVEDLGSREALAKSGCTTQSGQQP